MILIQWSSPNLEEAKTLSRLLLERHLVACASLIPHVQSYYWWQGKLEISEETKVILKTEVRLFHAVQDFIVQHSSYKVPEILKISVDEALPAYQQWVLEETQTALS